MNLVENKIPVLKEICAIHHVEKLYLFGSALNESFSPTSDIDLLVRFKPMDLRMYFDNYLNLKNRLMKLFGREIDLLEEQTLKNPILIQAINDSKKLVYE